MRKSLLFFSLLCVIITAILIAFRWTHQTHPFSGGTRKVYSLPLTLAPPPSNLPPPAATSYPWEKQYDLITKEHFRCRGNASHSPKKITLAANEYLYLEDCDGIASHSLPVQDGKEYLYPILPKLLNYLQEKTRKPVVIVAGHRCFAHDNYCRGTHRSRPSKHLLGAAVTFYVKGLEREPEIVAKHLRDYYPNTPFERYQGSSDATVLPWMNKEVFIKITAPSKEDDEHRLPHPYLELQVRYDTERDRKVSFDWDVAQTNLFLK